MENKAKQSNKIVNKNPSQSLSHVTIIQKETNRIFTKYQKAFSDLARYDRGEKIASN